MYTLVKSNWLGTCYARGRNGNEAFRIEEPRLGVEGYDRRMEMRWWAGLMGCKSHSFGTLDLFRKHAAFTMSRTGDRS